MDNRPEPSAVCVRGGVTRIGYKYSRALLIMKRCTWAFLSPESRRSPETGRTLWSASSSCSLADCLWRPHQKLGQVQCFSHDTEFLSLALFSCLRFKHAELHDALANHWAEPRTVKIVCILGCARLSVYIQCIYTTENFFFFKEMLLFSEDALH